MLVSFSFLLELVTWNHIELRKQTRKCLGTVCITRNLKGEGQRTGENVQLSPPKPSFRLGKSLPCWHQKSVLWDSGLSRFGACSGQCPVCTGITHTWAPGARLTPDGSVPGGLGMSRLSAGSWLPLPSFLQTCGPGSWPSRWPPQDHSDNERKCGHQLPEGWGFRTAATSPPRCLPDQSPSPL